MTTICNNQHIINQEEALSNASDSHKLNEGQNPGEKGQVRSPGRPRGFDREKVLCKALKLFWEQGYMQTTMAQLCDVMDIRSPSLYCAYGSKADLFLEALKYYKEKYWSEAFAQFLATDNLYEATKKLFDDTARILLAPDAPCGCLTVYSAMTLPPKEKEILQTIAKMRSDTKKIFREKLKDAVRSGQIPADSNIPAITGALANFFEGLSLQARDDICLSELLEIAALGVDLLPQKRGNTPK